MPSPHHLHPSSMPGPSHFIHVIHHSVHHKRKDTKDPKKKLKTKSGSVEREGYSPHPTPRNLSHSFSTSQINLSSPRPIPFPKSPSHSSAFPQQNSPSQPNTPAQVHYSDLPPVPYEHKRSRSTSMSNVLQKRRPTISLSNTQQVFHPQSTPYSPSPLQLLAPQKPLHGILKNRNSTQQLQPPHATFQYSKCTGRKKAVCVCSLSSIVPGADVSCARSASTTLISRMFFVDASMMLGECETSL